jgi:hypothetical protein
MNDAEIVFYLAEDAAVFAGLPQSIEDYWAWQCSAAAISPYWGRYHWVLQTHLYLKAHGYSSRLTREIPERGIIVSHVDCLPYGFRPNAKQFLVVMLVDREVPHPHGHVHIVHNPVQLLPLRLAHSYMPPWPQIGLIAREPARRACFRTVSYFGYPNNLHPRLCDAEFQGRLAELGLHLHVPGPSRWHDFADTDVVLAVRTLGRQLAHLNKPSLKLFNAWAARAPAVLGYETAYRSEGHPGQGYLEATNPGEVIDRLSELKASVALRDQIVEFGTKTVAQFAPAVTVGRWVEFFEKVARPGLSQWRQQGAMGRLGHRASGAVRERLLWRRPGWFKEG